MKMSPETSDVPAGGLALRAKLLFNSLSLGQESWFPAGRDPICSVVLSTLCTLTEHCSHPPFPRNDLALISLLLKA